MKKTFIVAALALASASSFAEDTWNRGYVWDAASGSGKDVWFGPGNKVTAGAVGRGASVLSTANGLHVAESGSVALRDGRAVVLSAKRFVPVAELLAGVGKVATGPYGLAAAIALPFFIDWVAGDGAQHIRITNGSLEKKGSTGTCTPVSSAGRPLSPYQSAEYTNTWGTNPASPSTCSWGWIVWGPYSWAQPYFYGVVTYSMQPAGWLPASLDDIAPYMTPRVPSTSAIAQLTSKGVELQSVPVEVTGPSPALAPVPPHVQTTQYPAPPAKTSTTTVAGNPYGIPSNTPTVTSSSTSSTSVSPGSKTSTGPAPTVAPKEPGPINSPTTTTTTSTYDPTTDKTTSTTVTETAPQTVTQTTTTTTNITNTTNTSNVTNTTVTITNITNNTTNETKTETDTSEPRSPDPTPTDCEKNPSSIACSEYGTPDNPNLPRTTSPVTVTPKTFSGVGSCPAPLSFTVPTGTYAIGFTPICDQLVYLKALMLAIAGIMAAYILADSFKVG